jgi:hypothetical protein
MSNTYLTTDELADRIKYNPRTIRNLTAGTARAVFHHFRTRKYFLDDQLLSTPL